MITVNAMGDNCPIPVIKTKKALSQLEGAGVIEVLVDNEIAVANVTKMATAQGGEVTSEQTGEAAYRVIIRVQGSTEEVPAAAKEDEDKGNMIVVISSDRMGEGNDELGKVLMKGFIYAVSQLDELPTKILFYNGGVTLTTEGSDSLEDLEMMEEEGVEILSCGTCLDYYNMKDKLAVGSVTNMYTIAESMAMADKIIRP